MPSTRGSRAAPKRSGGSAAATPPEASGREPSGLAQLVTLLGSLQLALLLLATASTLLLTGTFFESWYGAAVAAQLIYQAWWFGLLLVLLAVNITCAALKKWPWKQYQTGFLITHVGLLTLLAGGALSAGFGTTGMLLLVDSPELASPAFGAVADDQLFDRRRDTLRVRRERGGQNDVMEVDFSPGWIPWNERGLQSAGFDPAARTLAWIGQPWSPVRRWRMDDLEIEIVAYAPQADWEPLRAASKNASRGTTFPAARVRIESPMTGKLPPQWVGDHDELRQTRLGPGLILWKASDCRPEQLEEFGREPSPAIVAEGELVIGWGGERWRWPVAKLQGAAPVPLADGWELAGVKYQADARQPANRLPVDPAISFELRPKGAAAYGLVTSARRAGAIFSLPGYPAPDRLPEGFWVWYHPPDPAYGDPSVRGVMQLAMSREGELWMRTLHQGLAGAPGWIAEPSVPLKPRSAPHAVWPAMQGKLTLEEFYPVAEPLPDCRPRERVGESEDVQTPPAIRCRLRRGGAEQEVWLPRRAGTEVVVPLGNEAIGLAYAQRREPLGFTVELDEAKLVTEAASGMPETQSSTLTFREQGVPATHGVTAFNAPVVYRGYKFYQGVMQPAGQDARGKPLHRSVLLVGYDPGVWLKYAGSLCVTAGIFCMFWMKAYFFGSWSGDESPSAETAAAPPTPE